MSVSFFVLRTPSSAPSRGAARVIWLLILWHRTVCFCLLFFVMHVFLFSLCYTFSARRSPPSRDCGLCHLPFSCWLSLFVSPPRQFGGLREGFDVRFPCLSACILLQFAFLRLAPPRHAGGSREGFDGGLSYHSAFFVSPPRHAGGTREGFLTVGCLIIVSAFRSITFLRVFPGFIARPFRRVGVGFEERIFDSWSS